MRIVFTNDPGSYGSRQERILRYLPEDAEFVIAQFMENSDNSQCYELLRDADIVINSYVYLGKKEIDAMEKCKVISFQCTGYNEVDLEYATQKGIAVTSVLDYCTQETAENAIAMMMALQRSTLIYNRSIHEKHIWNCMAVTDMKRVEGQTMGIIGLGKIGRHVARIAGAGLGMNVIAYDPFLPTELADSKVAKMTDLDTLLAQSDVVSIHMNLSDDNAYMIDRACFEKMKRKPIIINESRGQAFREADLAWALDEGIVKGAGLDMLESEFPDSDYLANCSLCGRENVIINPHSGFLSNTSVELIYKYAVDNAICCYEGRYKDARIVRNGIGLD